MALDRLQKSLAGYHMITSHSKSLGICHRGLRTLLVESYIVSHLLFGSFIWGHVLCAWGGSAGLLSLTYGSPSDRAKIKVHHRRALQWALG